MDDPGIDRENRRWLRDLTTAGPARDAARRELYLLLLRVAKSEARRRAPLLKLNGPELEDIAHQAAADALMAVGERLDKFRGEARFTTWASKFVIFDVATKMNRHYWHRHEVPDDQVDWSKTASDRPRRGRPGRRPGSSPRTITSAVEENLSERQRHRVCRDGPSTACRWTFWLTSWARPTTRCTRCSSMRGRSCAPPWWRGVTCPRHARRETAQLRHALPRQRHDRSNPGTGHRSDRHTRSFARDSRPQRGRLR